MNKTFTLVWSAARSAYIVAHEHAKSHGKPSSTSKNAATAAILLGLLGNAGFALAGPPVAPPANALPTGGQVAAGSASITQSTNRMDINQSTQKAVLNWQSFNIGADAQVNFAQPSASAVALNRVLSSDPSAIYGKLSANGQVFLVNPNGVLFGAGARIDVGGLVATTHKIALADFMAGNVKFERSGSTAGVLNEGELKAALGGYIALLAPEVRNQGIIVAQAGTVALASGEAITLHIEGGNTLAGITVTPSQISALVENKTMVLAPGGLIILSAQAANKLQGGLIKNSGTLDASSLVSRGGRILLDASERIEHTGSITAAGSATHAGGSVEITAPQVELKGSVDVSGSTGGVVLVKASENLRVTGEILARGLVARGGEIWLKLAQTLNLDPSARIDASGATGGGLIALESALSLKLSGSLSAVGESGSGGDITLSAGGDVTLLDATIDTSGTTQGGKITVRANPLNDPTAPPKDRPLVALTGNTTLRSNGRKGKGGAIEITGDELTLGSGSTLDASGATGGGMVQVGGGWQGSGGLYQATTVTMEHGALINVSATKVGAGGTAVLWSDITQDGSVTRVDGEILARGGSASGNIENAGGKVETSGHKLTIGANASVNTSGAVGAPSGLWLLDPYDFTIGTGGDISANTLQTALTAGAVNITTTAGATTCSGTGITCAGTSGTAGDIIFNDAVSWSANTLTLSAYHSVLVNNVLTVSGTGGLTVTTNTSGATDTESTSAGYLKMKQTRVGTTGPDEFTGKINWSSSGSPTIDGTVYTVLNDKTTLNTTLSSNLTGNYVLGSDMTAIGAWTPVAADTGAATRFRGKLDGFGHTLSGLTVASTANEGRGVFAAVGNGMRLANIGLVNSTITGGAPNSVGGFIGKIESTTTAVNISNVFTGSNTNVVSGYASGPSAFGGLVGNVRGGPVP